MKKKELYLIIFSLIIILNMLIFNKSVILYFPYILLILLYSNKTIKDNEFILLAMIYPSRIIQFLSLFIFIFFNIKRLQKINTKSKIILIFIFYIAFMGFFNILFFDTNIINFILQFVIYLIYLVTLCILSENTYSSYTTCELIKKIMYYEIIIAIIQLMYYKASGDGIRGSFISAHYFGVYIILALYIQYMVYNNIFKMISNNKIYVFMSIITLYLTDSKHVYICFLLAVIIQFIFGKKIKNNMTVTAGLSIALSIFIGSYIVQNENIKSYLQLNFGDVAQYIYNNNYNQKYRYFKRTADQFDFPHNIIGYGIGEYGSQIANFRAYDYIYSNENKAKTRSKYIDSYINEKYEDAMGDLMTKEYVTNIPNISLVLSYPLISLIPFIAELGIIGYILWLKVLSQICNNYKDHILTIFLLLICIFDIYFEIPGVFIMIVLMLKLNKENKIDCKNRQI